MKRKEFGFTTVEVLTVITIIALLVSLLIPSLKMVRKIAKETKQKAQLTAIDLALLAFKNDYGSYPPSDWPLPPSPGDDYCGAQKLAEALLGWDLMGFHPDSEFTSDGRTKNDSREIYPDPLDPDDPDDEKNLKERRGPYLELATANAFELGYLFSPTTPLKPDTFVLCDVFGVKKVHLLGGKIVTAGTPILYFKANTASKTIQTVPMEERIYNLYDNLGLLGLGKIRNQGELHELVDPTLENFYRFDNEGGIRDPKVTVPWPHRPDSYILITAGADGEYGTEDDICNF